MIRNQKGFTLIEIIAVLVILGILAAVAVPKYIDLQTEARNKAIQGAVAALQSTATQTYAQALLNGNATGGTWTTPPAASIIYNVGDFWGTIDFGQQTTVTVTGAAPAGYESIVGQANAEKTFNLW